MSLKSFFLHRVLGVDPAPSSSAPPPPAPAPPAKYPRRVAYRGGDFDRMYSDWKASNRSADRDIQKDLLVLRARARELKRNSPVIRRYLQHLRNNVVGYTGIGLQGQTRDSQGRLDKAANDAIESAWKDWGRCVSVDGRQSLRSFCALALDTWATDGEVFIRKIRGYKQNPYRFALQFIDPDLVDDKYNVRAGDGQNEVRMGIEVDGWGRPVAYHCWSCHPADIGYGSARTRSRIPAEEIIHLYEPDRVNQTRGVPQFASVMTFIHTLDEYIGSEAMAARVGSSKMGWFERTEEGGPTLAEDQEAEPLRIEATPGTAEELPFGMKFVPWDVDHPSTAFGAFVKSMLRFIASGLGTSYNTLANDLEGVNYSSMRSGVLDDRDTWRTLQQWLIEIFMDPIYREWLQFANLAGKLALDSRDYRKYQEAVWSPRGWDWVDPLNDVQAAVMKIKNGLGSRTKELASQGEAYEKVLEDLKDENDLATTWGIPILEAAASTVAPRRDAPAKEKPSEEMV